MGFWDAVASAGPHASNLHLAPDNDTYTSSLNFYRPDAVSDAQPTVSKHWRQEVTKNKSEKITSKINQGYSGRVKSWHAR